MLFPILASLSPYILTVFLGLCGVIYWRITRKFTEWKDRSVPGPTPSFPFGNLKRRMVNKISLMELDDDLYFNHSGKKYCIYYEFSRPALMIGDLTVLKHVFVKDFDHFINRQQFNFAEADKVMVDMLNNLRGDTWRDVRNLLTPTFSSGKIKRMFPLITTCGEDLATYLGQQKGQQVDIRDLFGRFTIDVIASTAFGMNCDSINNPDSEFPKMASQFFKFNSWTLAKKLLISALPACVISFLNLRVFPQKPILFFSEIIRTTIRLREESGVKREDYLHLLINARREEEIQKEEAEGNKPRSNDKGLSDDLIVSQALLFFLTGYETTANTLSFTSYNLASNQDLQDKVIEEVDSALAKHGGLTYEAIHDMTYLDMFISETLRLYPPVSRTKREVTKDYRLPGTDLTLPRDLCIVISIWSIHHDPDYYPDPYKFDPERFSPENRVLRDPYCYMPFGMGPRNCIAMRFALLEVKVALISVLRHYRLVLGEKTETPLRLDPMAFPLKAIGGIWVKAEPRQEA